MRTSWLFPAERASPPSSVRSPPIILLRIEEAEIGALARSGTVATLAPGTAWWIRSRQAPARALIEAGVPVAVASDSNPGTCHTESLASVAAHACL
jgi:imidazolonepropionase